MNSILSVFFTAFMAMFKIFLISCVGIACAVYPKSDPLLNRDALRHFSRLNTFLLTPALVVYALGSTLNMQQFIHLSLLFPFGICIILVSYVFGYLLKCIHEDNEELYKSSLVCVCSPNGISLPILVMASLCENSEVNADFDDDAELCFDEASSMLFIYIIPWLLFFWSYGYTTLSSLHDKKPELTVASSDDDDDCEAVAASRDDKLRTVARKLWLVLQNPALVAVYVGLIVGLIPGLGSYLFNRVTVLQPVGGAVEVLATPVVALNSLVMAASLAHINVNWADIFPWLSKKDEEYELQQLTGSPGDGCGGEVHSQEQVEMDVELEVMDLSDVGITRSGCGQRSRTSTLSTCVEESRSRSRSRSRDRHHSSTDTDTKCEGELLGEGDCNSQQTIASAKKNDIPQFRSVIYLILCRLILCPLVLSFLVYFSVQAGFIPKQLRLMQLLILVEAGSPPAQMVIVVLNQLGFQGTASTVAYTYVFLYLFSILTITLWSTVAMLLFY